MTVTTTSLNLPRKTHKEIQAFIRNTQRDYLEMLRRWEERAETLNVEIECDHTFNVYNK